MTNEEYKSRRSHLRSINPHTADCPPADELQTLQEQYIEDRAFELRQNLYDSPERLQEYILESPLESTSMLEMCRHLGKIMMFPSSTAVADFLIASITFFEEAVMNEAIEEESEI